MIGRIYAGKVPTLAGVGAIYTRKEFRSIPQGPIPPVTRPPLSPMVILRLLGPTFGAAM